MGSAGHPRAVWQWFDNTATTIPESGKSNPKRFSIPAIRDARTLAISFVRLPFDFFCFFSLQMADFPVLICDDFYARLDYLSVPYISVPKRRILAQIAEWIGAALKQSDDKCHRKMKGAIGKNSINNSIVASDNIFAWAIDAEKWRSRKFPCSDRGILSILRVGP